MTVINDRNMFDWYIHHLKTNYGFDQVLFKENNKYFIFFDCLKDGESYEVRYVIDEDNWEVWIKNRWEYL